MSHCPLLGPRVVCRDYVAVDVATGGVTQLFTTKGPAAAMVTISPSGQPAWGYCLLAACCLLALPTGGMPLLALLLSGVPHPIISACFTPPLQCAAFWCMFTGAGLWPPAVMPHRSSAACSTPPCRGAASTGCQLCAVRPRWSPCKARQTQARQRRRWRESGGGGAGVVRPAGCPGQQWAVCAGADGAGG